MNLRRENVRMVGKLAVVAAGMFAFGYALVPIYKAICEMTGINILALGDKNMSGAPYRLYPPTHRWMHRAPSRSSLMPMHVAPGSSSQRSAR
jgi:hypothetical protein